MTSTDVIRRPDRWIEHWEPDDEEFWESGGKRIARRNLVLSMFAEHIGFCVWVLLSLIHI